jgi:hypothetical protein
MPFIKMTTADVKISPADAEGAFRLLTSEFKSLTPGGTNRGFLEPTP